MLLFLVTKCKAPFIIIEVCRLLVLAAESAAPVTQGSFAIPVLAPWKYYTPGPLLATIPQLPSFLLFFRSDLFKVISIPPICCTFIHYLDSSYLLHIHSLSLFLIFACCTFIHYLDSSYLLAAHSFIISIPHICCTFIHYLNSSYSLHIHSCVITFAPAC
jgi:hypothetical protein